MFIYHFVCNSIAGIVLKHIPKTGKNMKPKTTPMDQGDLFLDRLDPLLNPRHPLFLLANQID